MKKRFRIWLNIVTICFCIAAIAVGVYAATNASVTASGKIGFTAHNSKITAGGYIYGHAAGNVHDGLPTDYNSRDTFSTITVDGTATGVTGTLNIGDRYFSDMASTDGTPAPIVIVIEVTNESNYDITVSTNLSQVTMPANVSVTLKNADTATSQTISNKAKATFEFTLTLNPSATGTAGSAYQSFDLTEFSIPLTSIKYIEAAKGFNVTIQTLSTLSKFADFGYSINGGASTAISSTAIELNNVQTITIVSMVAGAGDVRVTMHYKLLESEPTSTFVSGSIYNISDSKIELTITENTVIYLI